MNEPAGFNLIEFEKANDLWEALSPLKPIKPAPSQFIYRGQGDASLCLQPGVFRDKHPAEKICGSRSVNADDQVAAELAILDMFARSCDLLGLKLPNDSIPFRQNQLNLNSADKYLRNPINWPQEELFELMALARHHGLPTRLLDWSKRSFVAAYFAASDALSKRNEWKGNDKLAVWALDIENLNNTNVRIVSVPGSVSVNMAAQAGVFTLLGLEGYRASPFEKKSLEDEFKTLPSSPLWKYTLPVTQAKSVLELCELFGVTAATLFPGFDGAVKMVIDQTNMWDKSN